MDLDQGIQLPQEWVRSEFPGDVELPVSTLTSLLQGSIFACIVHL
jgi:hypothetical protein